MFGTASTTDSNRSSSAVPPESGASASSIVSTATGAIATATASPSALSGATASSSAAVRSRTSVLPYFLLAIALLLALGFEFVNGFHDTANAVATVIYTHSLAPNFAVGWSGACHFLGVLTSTGRGCVRHTAATAGRTDSAGAQQRRLCDGVCATHLQSFVRCSTRITSVLEGRAGPLISFRGVVSAQ
ncbi:hypothetical protein LMG28138_05835 [Pararobbsia alpina]|uniref:Phosphate transporter n=1 Tax=Pararobbsia alpina TaxID=621374 RepID=A0A6S7D4R2_9BURK|nr:hypothetical protein LMG28138_05835 [Pararobbsia alpina]